MFVMGEGEGGNTELTYHNQWYKIELYYWPYQYKICIKREFDKIWNVWEYHSDDAHLRKSFSINDLKFYSRQKIAELQIDLK